MTKHVFGFLAIIVSALLLTFMLSSDINEEIGLASLTQEELWDIEYAEQVLHEAYLFDASFSLNEEKFLQLLTQAWQGDKNAQLQFAQAKISEEMLLNLYHLNKHDSQINQLLKKINHRITLPNGTQLAEPKLLKHRPENIIKELADIGHPASAKYLAEQLEQHATTEPLDKEELQQLLQYYQYMIDGGYKPFQSWADHQLFKQGNGIIRDGVNSRIIPLTDHRTNLPTYAIDQAITKGYQICAQSGSYYCMLRLAEAHLYGIGTNTDPTQAYRWALLISNTSNNAAGTAIVQPYDLSLLTELQRYALQIANQAKDQMTATQVQQVDSLLADLAGTMVFDEHWLKQRENIPPMR